MVAVFHSVLGCRTEGRVFGNEAPKKQMVRWIVPVTHLPACYVRLLRPGGAVRCGICTCAALRAELRASEVTADFTEACVFVWPWVVFAAVGKPNRFILKSGFFTTNFYCSIDATGSRFRELKYKANFLSPLFSQPLTSLFYWAVEMRNSSILNKLPTLYL